jgi:glycosyltransferase involved in cell wall biosynthesis
MSGPIRLTVVMTHPAQYMSPWFRHIATHRPDLDLTVLYGALPSPEQQGTGFGAAFEWDVPVADGYRFDVCGDGAGKSFDSDRFRGIDVPDIERRIEQTHPDVVVVPGWHSIMQVRALRACRRLGVPVLYRGDSTLFSGPRGLVRPIWAVRTRAMLQRFDGYLSVGTHADEYLRRFGIAEPLIARSPHCVDNARFAAEAARLRAADGRTVARAALGVTPGDFVVLFAGKFTERKRPLDAVRAVARLGGSAVLVMAGDGPLRDAASSEARRLGVRATCTGFLNQTELPSAFAAADCVLVPSAWESWGLIVNEALASGVPCVVTTGVASSPDLIVEGETGHAVPAGDIAAMAARLASVRERIAAGSDFAPRCQKQAATCGFDVAADGLTTLCRRVLARRPAPHARTNVVACCGAMVSVYGLERSTFELLEGLRAHGASIHCIVNSWGSSSIADLAASAGASWVPGHYRMPLKWRGTSLRAAARLAWEVARVSAVLLREARRRRATHVFVPDLGAALYNLPALAVLRAVGVAVIARLGNAPEQLGLYRFLWGRLINAVVDEFVANSRFTASALTANGVADTKVRIIGVPPPLRRCGDTSPAASKHEGRIIYVGQLIPGKGCDRLLEAVAILAHKGLDVSLDVVGDTGRWEPDVWKGYIARLIERAARPDLAGRVRFLGAREDVPALLAAASLHCFPSTTELREGFGIVTVEAKAVGVPSVVTPSGALPELIAHEEDGFVCADDSVESLVAGLQYFLADRNRLIEAGRRAHASSARYTRARFLEQWLALFRMSAADMNRSGALAGVAHSHGD